MQDGERAVLARDGGAVTVQDLNRQLGTDWPERVDELIRAGKVAPLTDWLRLHPTLDAMVRPSIPAADLRFGPLYRRPGKIWGIGLNYADHAADLNERVPADFPGSFLKPATSIIGPGDAFQIPVQSQRTTVEAELGIIIGQRCRDVPRARWREVVAGFTPILDATAEDILRLNPRYLTLSKSFDTFFSFGPLLITPDEITNIETVMVSTVLNGEVRATNQVARMTYPPDFLIAFHSRVMTLEPGDIISSGTPGAVPVCHGDRVECRISGFPPLVNAVQDLKITGV
ncbi:MAG: fumarylacetoacetate hydrolase family protein [Acidobacteria bacterium]|nr:fumarylacetoacetate hydrolase family protein [Acidobacteriota bacterium]